MKNQRLYQKDETKKASKVGRISHRTPKKRGEKDVLADNPRRNANYPEREQD